MVDQTRTFLSFKPGMGIWFETNRLPSENELEDLDPCGLVPATEACVSNMSMMKRIIACFGDMVLDISSGFTYLRHGQPLYNCVMTIGILMSTNYAKIAGCRMVTPHSKAAEALRPLQADFILFWRESRLQV